ncbi:MAG TPA: hypothetical protein VHS32_00325, partial [Streptosporangiaceae bacterium]|nr:hypothetical protein [Streptosporangiaceae bacterium]
MGDPAVGREPGDWVGERGPAEPARQVGVDRGDRGLPGGQRGPVVPERRGQRRVVEPLRGDP